MELDNSTNHLHYPRYSLEQLAAAGDRNEVASHVRPGSLDSDFAAYDVGNDSSPFNKRSKPATPLQATIQLLEVASRIENAVSELKRYTVVLSNVPQSNASRARAEQDDKSQVLASLQQSIAPFLTLASQSIIDSATLLAPIQGSKVLHSRQDAEWKRSVLDCNKLRDQDETRRPGLQLIDAWVTSCYLNDEEFWRKRYEKKQKAKPKPALEPVQVTIPVPVIPAMEAEENTRNTIYARVTELQKQPLALAEDGKTIMLPIPQNGTEYTKIEALSVLTRCVKNQRGTAMKEMVDKKYVPWHRARVYNMLKNYNQNIEAGILNGGIYNENWGKKGRPKLGEEQNPKKEKVSAKRTVVKFPKMLSTKGGGMSANGITLHGTAKPPPKLPPVILPFPPKNGKYYLKSEFLQIISAYPKSKHPVDNGHSRGQIIKHLVQNKLVNCTKTTVYRFLEKWEKDPTFIIHNDEWQSSGRTNAFSDDEINTLANYIHSHRRTYDCKDINDLLVDIARKRLTARGQSPISIPDKLGKSTVRNYITMLAAKLELLEGVQSDGKKKKGDVFNYVDGKLILGRDEDDVDCSGL